MSSLEKLERFDIFDIRARRAYSSYQKGMIGAVELSDALDECIKGVMRLGLDAKKTELLDSANKAVDCILKGESKTVLELDDAWSRLHNELMKEAGIDYDIDIEAYRAYRKRLEDMEERLNIEGSV